MISKENAEHFVWKDVCDGWFLVQQSNLSVVHERIAPGLNEQRHFHKVIRQFYFVLFGQASLELNGKLEKLGAFQGVEIPPETPHQMRNDSSADIEFLIISSGLAKNDVYAA